MSRTLLLIDELIEKRSKGVEFLKISTRMKLMMKGIDVQKIRQDTPDDAEIIHKILEVAKEYNITLTK